jgi:hypothetical protein
MLWKNESASGCQNPSYSTAACVAQCLFRQYRLPHNQAVCRKRIMPRPSAAIRRQAHCEDMTASPCQTSPGSRALLLAGVRRGRATSASARPGSASWATRAVSVKGVSPVAWQHVNLFGTIEFSRTPLSIDIDALARYDDPDYWNRALRGISTTAE